MNKNIPDTNNINGAQSYDQCTYTQPVTSQQVNTASTYYDQPIPQQSVNYAPVYSQPVAPIATQQAVV